MIHNKMLANVQRPRARRHAEVSNKFNGCFTTWALTMYIMFRNGYMFVKFGNIREGPNYCLYNVLGFEYKEGVLVPLKA